MKFIGMILSLILVTAVYWVPIAFGVVLLLNGAVIGVLPIALGLWLILRT